MIGDPPLRVAAIDEQQRPMGAGAIRSAIVDGHEQEVGRGGVSIIDRLQRAARVLQLHVAQQMGYRRAHQPCPGGEHWIDPLQLLLEEIVIPLDMGIAQPLGGPEHRPRRDFRRGWRIDPPDLSIGGGGRGRGHINQWNTAVAVWQPSGDWRGGLRSLCRCRWRSFTHRRRSTAMDELDVIGS
ncbi:hypothetical protein ILFOPFJJ_07054 [Ensifer psoraleae]|nr:hypothetical protein [Sinorhizobium psoraleae]